MKRPPKALPLLLAAASLAAQQGSKSVRILTARETGVAGVARAPGCYHQFREGGVVLTSSGRIVLVAQGREESSWSDRSGQDLVCRWSDDHGDTWSRTRLVASAGAFSICPNATVYDAETDTVHVLFNAFQWDYRKPATRRSMRGRECRQFQVHSSDRGASWSQPRELTAMLGSRGVTTVFGSGEGIQLHHGAHKGRLLVPGGFQKPWGNRVFYSDDHGVNWQVGTSAPRQNVLEANVRLECKVAELMDGTLVMNARCTPHRVRAFSRDGGLTWTPQEIDKGLPAVSCNGALLATRDGKQREVLLLSVPRGPKRTHGTVFGSLDGGNSWPLQKTLVDGPFAYSSLVQLADGRIGLIFESGGHQHLDLIRFRVEDIVGPVATPTNPAPKRREPLVKLSRIFTDHMVLQRDKPVSIFGTAAPGTSIAASFGGHERTTTAPAGRNWLVTLPSFPAERRGRSLVVRAELGNRTEKLELRDVVCGDIWVCAGQSNMRWRIKQSAEAKRTLANAEIPDLRLIDFEGTLYPNAVEYGVAFLRELTADNYYTTSGWHRSSRDSALNFSAVAHAFGRRLVSELGVPIGLVHNAVGGVPMEAYLPPAETIAASDVRSLMHEWWQNPAYPTWCQQRGRKNLAAWLRNPQGPRPHHPFEPSFLFSAGIEPLANFTPRGVIWYQGESNATATVRGAARDQVINKHSFESLIRGFRDLWRDPGLPFYFVQLPGLNRDWPLFREMQLEIAREVANTGMAVAIDLGHPTNVHPRRKDPVGERLARLALAGTYGRDILASGPLFKEHRIKGRRVHIHFDYSTGLRTTDGKPPIGFEVAGVDHAFHPGTAKITGDHVIVSAAGVVAPIAVRYAFRNDPTTNLVNADNLPASPFRTDRWRLAPASGTLASSSKLQPGTGSFEKVSKGPLRAITTAIGRFEAAPGHAEITDRFAHSGSQCLRLLGGDERTVTFLPNNHAGQELSFWAERWTRREPFSFRIAAWHDGTWQEIFVGDLEVRVGRGFLSHVRVAVPGGTTKLRFRSTAPSGSGVLLDDLIFGQAEPMRIVGARVAPWTAPALHGCRDNPVAKTVLETAGSKAPPIVTECRIVLPETTRLSDIETVRVYYTHTAAFSTRRMFGVQTAPARELVFKGEQALRTGVNQFWISIELANGASLDRRVSADCVEITLADGTKTRPSGNGQRQRIGVAVRSAGQDGCHTYRIPGLATTNKGTLIAVYDCRYKSSRDLPGDIDVGMSRSIDGGSTWEPRRVIMDMGSDRAWQFDGIGDPAITVDRVTGTIWVAATWSHGKRSWRGSGPGLEPEQTGQLILVRSDDDGKTWSRPINITRQVKDSRWRFVLQGPGKGITLRDGTLVFPAQYRSADDSPAAGKPFSTLIYSRDHGKSWKIGTGVKVDTTEAQLVELASGALMINCRDNRGGSRSVYTTRNLGQTWQVHPSSRGTLPEPVCMASLIRVEHAKAGPLLFFSNPATKSGRFNMTLKVSSDEGHTWDPKRHTLYDERKGSGYSCLTLVDAEHVGVLYEGRRELYFLRMPIRELVAER